MKSKIAWFMVGFLVCLFLGILIPNVQQMRNPLGKISYIGDAVEITSDLNKELIMIGPEGALLPYGMYHMKLKNGKTLQIHKNNRGNIKVKEEQGLVLIDADENVIEVSLEK
ncbi:MAG: hypothetical protein RL693_585 [Verrucomicrobiota bacterium]|jgi:hypothetical protein